MSDAGDGAAARRPRRLVRLVIGLGLVARTLRSPGCYEGAIVGAIAVAALAGLGRESQARAIERLLAYARKLDQRAGRAIGPGPGDGRSRRHGITRQR